MKIMNGTVKVNVTSNDVKKDIKDELVSCNTMVLFSKGLYKHFKISTHLYQKVLNSRYMLCLCEYKLCDV